MSKNNDRFMETFNFASTSTCLYKCNIYFQRNDVDYIIFVEGKTDEEFYTHCRMPFFNENRIEFIISTSKKGDEEHIGKKAVVELCREIVLSHKKYLRKAIFIVDHDYFGIEEFGKECKADVDKFLTILPCYSFENFFVLPSNLKIIESNYLYDSQIDHFNNTFKKFVQEIREFYELKRTMTACYTLHRYFSSRDLFRSFNSTDEISKIYSADTIETYYINYDVFINEKEAMAEIIYNDKHLFHVHEQLKNLSEFKTDELWIKGKILLNFLVKYLTNVNGRTAELYKGEVYLNMIKLIDVSFEIKKVNL